MTQCEKILDHMRARGSITSMQAMQEYGIMRLASRINDLREAGFAIAKQTIKGKNRYGEHVSYAAYRLEER